MLSLIYGGSGSGKSAFAEQWITKLAGEQKKYYLATMQVFDEEGKKKIERHRQMRAGKEFETIEQPNDIGKALEQMNPSDRTECALLECMSNLAANEMFSGDGKSREEVVTQIIAGVRRLRKHLKQLVIVSNNVFEDGIRYDDSTMEYIRALGDINAALAAEADTVMEVVVGIPVVVKGTNICG